MAEKGDGQEEHLRSMRERLYSRGVPPQEYVRTELKDAKETVRETWDIKEPVSPAAISSEQMPSFVMTRKKRSFRTTLLSVGLLFFILSLLLSGSFLLFGKNMISGDNISLELKGPFAIGGGEELSLQVMIANRNAVPIEAATLILEYPLGTQSTEGAGKDLVRDRKALTVIEPGAVLNVPLSARVFGEENEEKNIKASIEYRVRGSNATFFKEAEPLRFKISSSPVVLSLDHVSKTASGQELELSVTVASNAPGPISDILLKAEYPQGFDYSDASLEPVSERDTWIVSSLAPEEKKTFTIRGVLVGRQDETQTFTFSVGVPSERDRYSLASIFTTQKREVTIEAPFLDIGVLVNGKKEEAPVISPGSVAQISVIFTNTLSTTLYDGKISVDLSGNGLKEGDVKVESGGFYDSKTNVLTWDFNDTDSLKTIPPGRSSTVTFSVTPHDAETVSRTPQIELTVHVSGNRVSDEHVAQSITGATSKTIKVESLAKLYSSLLYSTGAFTNSGPIPLKAEEVTTYTIFLYVKNGTNAITDGVVTTTLPPYVTWLDRTTEDDAFTYNAETREVRYKLGDVKANEEKESAFQISVRPSLTQAGQVINLVGEQRLRATDRFTGTTLRSEAPVLTSQLFADPEYEDSDGRVQE